MYPPPLHTERGCQTVLFPCSKEGLGHVEDGLD